MLFKELTQLKGCFELLVFFDKFTPMFVMHVLKHSRMYVIMYLIPIRKHLSYKSFSAFAFHN